MLPAVPLDPDAARAVGRLLRDEAQRHRLLAVSAHDRTDGGAGIGLTAIHLTPTVGLLGLTPPAAPEERAEAIDDLELQLGWIEIGEALGRLLAGDGFVVERLLDPRPILTTPELEELPPLVRRCLPRSLYRHYGAVATQAFRSLGEEPSREELRRLISTCLVGAHLLRHGRLELDLEALLGALPLPGAAAILDGDDGRDGGAGRRLAQAALGLLDQAYAASSLPGEPDGKGELQEWLIALRLRCR